MLPAAQPLLCFIRQERASHGSPHGRVDDWRGGGRLWGVAVGRRLSPCAGASFRTLAPFPVAAHRTGRAGFRHPALRLASHAGMRRARTSRRCQAQDPERSEDRLFREPPGSARRNLVPSNQEAPDAFLNMLIERPVMLWCMDVSL